MQLPGWPVMHALVYIPYSRRQTRSHHVSDGWIFMKAMEAWPALHASPCNSASQKTTRRGTVRMPRCCWMEAIEAWPAAAAVTNMASRFPLQLAMLAVQGNASCCWLPSHGAVGQALGIPAASRTHTNTLSITCCKEHGSI